MFYASPAYTTLRLPSVEPGHTGVQAYRDGSKVSSFSQSELVNLAEKSPAKGGLVVSASVNTPTGFVSGVLAPLA